MLRISIQHPLMGVLYALYFLLLSSAQARRVSLLSTDGEKVELRWDVRSTYPTDTWNEETYAGPNNTNARAYVSCALQEDKVDNWLFPPVRDSGSANRVSIRTSYSLRDCFNYHGRYCKETFALYYKLVPKGDSGSIEKFNPNEWLLVARLTGGPKISETGLSRNQETHTVVVNGSNIRFAFRDTGACVSVLGVQVFYDVCAEETLQFATYPETATASNSVDTVDVRGRCTQNAEPIRERLGPTAMCRSDGTWKGVTEAGCHCKPGFYSTPTNECRACGTSKFKEHAGPGECRNCPNFSTSSTGSAECICVPGYFRAAKEGPSSPCSKPPSKPTRLRSYEIGQTSVMLEWEEPSNLGGRPDLWYRWECPTCPSAIQVTPADKKLTSRQLKIEGLDPDTIYTFMLYALNEVSQFAPTAADYAITEVKTLPLKNHLVTDLKVDSAGQGEELTVSWTALQDTRAVDYEVEMRNNGSYLRTILTRLTYYQFDKLNLHTRYEFRVRANADGWGPWTKPIGYDRTKGHDDTVSHSHQRDSTASSNYESLVLIFFGAGSIIVLVTVLTIYCRKRSVNRKQMSDLDVLDNYKQDTMTPDYPSALRAFPQSAVTTGFAGTPGKVSAPLITTYGGTCTPKNTHYGSRFKPYVDPTTYEDPSQALNEFTYDIDPHAVYITSVIGGGEFGDVCMGHLDRAAAGVHGGKEVETVAIKTLKPGSLPKAKADFLLEASIMGQFDHPNVIRLVGVVTKNEPVMIVTEYMSNGSLDNFLRARDATGDLLGLGRMLDMLKGIAAGMKYLTDKGYVHRDLAARNVLVDSSFCCKIADFGLSRGVDNTAEQEYTTNGGKIPVRWTAPEAITHRKFTASSDVWSFGVLMWEVVSMGERPYWDWTNQKVISEVMMGFRLPPPMNSPPAIHKLMLWCWKWERHERPSFSQLLAILERYSRNPELVHADTPRSAHSMHNLAAVGYGSVGVASSSGVSSSRATPPPPSSLPPPQSPRTDDFLRTLGLGHCAERLHREGIHTVADLARLNQLDYLAFGMMESEYTRIRDALSGFPLHSSAPRFAQTHTLPHRGSVSRGPSSSATTTLARPNAHDNGFFV